MKSPHSPVWLTRTVLLAAIFGFFYRGYMVYMVEDHAAQADMGPFWDFVHGVGPAPFQYRIGVLRTAGWFYIHHHVPFRYSYSLLDLIGSTVAILLGYELLRRRSFFRNATLTVQWLASLAYAGLVLYFVCWQDFYKKPETEPAAAITMLLLWLWSAPEEGGLRAGASRFAFLLNAALILALTLALSLIRADLAFSLALGVLAVTFLRHRGALALPRTAALATAGLSAVVALGTQAVMMKVIYPHARPYAGAVCMLPLEIRHPWEFIVFLAYILPTAWTLREVRRLRFTGDAAGLAFLLASVPFTVLWIAIGRVEEVRIFLPLALACAPLTVAMLSHRATTGD